MVAHSRSAFAVALAAMLALVGCRDVPAPVEPVPGSISGRLVMALPGRTQVTPVANAQAEVLGTGLITRSDEQGYFEITGITSSSGQMLFRADINGDGRPDRQKLIGLQTLKAGLGRQIALGEVLLAENAVVRGKVLRSDTPATSGHAGTLVFVPIGPYTTTTSDDGSFVLNDLPEGNLSIAFFRAGYASAGFDSVSLSSGQELTLRTISLAVEQEMPQPAVLNGKVLLATGGPAEGSQVVLEGKTGKVEQMTGADGSFTFANVEVGIYSLSAGRSDASAARLVNLLVSGGVVTLPSLVLGPGATMTGGGGGGTGATGGGTFLTGGGFENGGGTAENGGGTAENGGGTASNGGGTASNGGGTASNGGGTASNGGGTASNGGGTASNGGGTTSNGGGTASNGGGTASNGGGTASNGGGTASNGGGTAVTDAGHPIVVPLPPSNVVATSGNGTVTLTWSPSASATSYTVYWSTNANITKQTGTRIAGAMSPFAHQPLTNGTQYYYLVTASNIAGESGAPSTPAAAIPSAPGPMTALKLLATRPAVNSSGAAPATTVMARFNNQIDAATVTPASFSLSGPGGVVMATYSTVGNVVTATPAIALAPETAYTLTIGTGLKDTLGQGLASAATIAFVTGSAAPTNLTAIVGSGAATFQWNAVPNALMYSVNRATTPGGIPDRSYTTTGTTLTATSLTQGISHYFTVTALTPAGVTLPSNEVAVVPTSQYPSPPSGVTVVPGRTTALLNWQPVSGSSGYSIYRANVASGAFTRVQQNYKSTTWLDTGLQTDSTFFYVVQTEETTPATSLVSIFSNEVAASLSSQKAPAPVAMATAGNRWARISWQAVPNATAYALFRTDTATDAVAQSGYVTSGLRFDDLDLTAISHYRWWVGAVTNNIIGDLAEVSADPVASLPPWAPVMGIPTLNVNSITLTHSSPRDYMRFDYYRSTTSGGPYTLLGTSAVDSTAMAGTTYFYVVKAISTAGVASEYSNEISASPLPAGTPAVPTGLQVQPASQAIQASWAPVLGATGYEVGYSTNPAATTFSYSCYTTERFDTRCSFGGLSNSTVIYVSVRSTNGNSYSAWSPSVAVQPSTNGLATPGIAGVAGKGAVTVSWRAIPGASTYQVYRRTPTTDWAPLGPPQISMMLTDTTVANDTPYKYAVQALASGAQSLWDISSWYKPTALLTQRPSNVQVTPFDGGYHITWDAIPGANGYTVNGGFEPGSSRLTSVAYCYTSEPYENHCNINTTATTLYISVTASTPVTGAGPNSDEVYSAQDVLSPDAPQATIKEGNGVLNLKTTISPGEGYRIYRRTRTTEWAYVAAPLESMYRETTVNRAEVRYAVQSYVNGGHYSPWAFIGFSSSESEIAATPQNVTATPTEDGIMLSWSPVLGATGYTISQATSPGGTAVTTIYSASPFDTRVGLTNTTGAPIYASVVANAYGSSSDFSAEASATPNPSIPALPTGFTMTAGNQAVALEWDLQADATSYRLYRRFEESDWRVLGTTTTRRYFDFDLQNGERVRYALQALNSAGGSRWAMTGGTYNPTTLVNGALPVSPLGLTAVPGNNIMQLDWLPVAGATGYQVLVSQNQEGPYNSFCTATGTFETHCSASLTNAMPRWFAVKATNGNNIYGVPSAEISSATIAAAPGKPTTLANLLVTAPGPGGTLRIAWTGAGGATSYKVFRRTSSSAPVQVATGLTATTYDDTGLTSGTTYLYYVQGVNGTGAGPWEGPKSALAP